MGADAPIPPVTMNGRQFEEPDGSSHPHGSDEPFGPRRETDVTKGHGGLEKNPEDFSTHPAAAFITDFPGPALAPP